MKFVLVRVLFVVVAGVLASFAARADYATANQFTNYGWPDVRAATPELLCERYSQLNFAAGSAGSFGGTYSGGRVYGSVRWGTDPWGDPGTGCDIWADFGHSTLLDYAAMLDCSVSSCPEEHLATAFSAAPSSGFSVPSSGSGAGVSGSVVATGTVTMAPITAGPEYYEAAAAIFGALFAAFALVWGAKVLYRIFDRNPEA